MGLHIQVETSSTLELTLGRKPKSGPDIEAIIKTIPIT